MQCPYNPKIQCQYIDTAGMDKPVECKDCPHYKQPDESGVIATGATPFLAWLINKWKYRKVKRANKKGRGRNPLKPDGTRLLGRLSDDRHQCMYECRCKHCDKIFSSSVPGFDCCPSCYI